MTKNGVLVMGARRSPVVLHPRRRTLLVVLYWINVFLTFTLSQLGMAMHWWQVRAEKPLASQARDQRRRASLTAILVVTPVLKFGGRLGHVAITSAFVGGCLWIRGTTTVGRALRRLDDQILDLPVIGNERAVGARHHAPTAVFLVNDYNGLGIHAVLAVPRLFGSHFQNFVFVWVGVIDSSDSRGRTRSTISSAPPKRG